ncbi:P-loop containing nucleoside triphosphate hydrolase protein [Mycena sp. CBHHK59/15]|nr:P-loop containing nucleoside triphosphate hydrolase protein [Mycena sp. CBHHK59/15]
MAKRIRKAPRKEALSWEEWGAPSPQIGWGAPVEAAGWGFAPSPNQPLHTSKTPGTARTQGNEPNDSDEEAVEAFDGIIERKEHYLIREQIWHQWTQRWVPYDSSLYDAPAAAQDLSNYFYVNIRHRLPGDEGELVLTNFSEPLLQFLRRVFHQILAFRQFLTTYGDEFYEDTPRRSADSLLPEIPILQAKLELIESNLTAESNNSNSELKRKFAVSIGCQEAKQGALPGTHVDQYLKDAQEHITVLTNYLLELYKPKAEKLALQLSDGCIEFALLIFYFELHGRYVLYPLGDGALGFRLERREYDNSMMSLNLSGTAYVWGGYSYTETSVQTSIDLYKGTRDLGLLTCQPLTPELEAMLAARDCQDRIIIDKIGYDNQDGYISEPNDEIPAFDEENLWLLPPYVSGFNLTKKRWAVFHVDDIGPVTFDENAWDHLVLDPETKVLIKALVQVTRNSNSSSKIITDVITGKGGGMISVLHGPPGTGKTLTAEAVAEHLKRPLYIVGTSELSIQPSTLEHNLKSILSLATAWDAVLLIDEADVLLEQRSLHEIERNSLVSVALRVLEYHRGVLFLTTNRIKTFDVAFLSRFSIAIKYPEHDLQSRRVIWRKFFDMAGVKTEDSNGSGRSTPTDMIKLDDPTKISVITEAELDSLAEKPFNGRTIKNLVRTAQALALSANEPMSKAHVDIVVKSQEKFLREFATT